MFTKVTVSRFRVYLAGAQTLSKVVRESTTKARFVPNHSVTYYIADDFRSGYGVTVTGELIGVFSLDKGNGDAIVTSAISNGATHLDCFDGYLPTFYARHGFVETSRVANWTEGDPDVVYMALSV